MVEDNAPEAEFDSFAHEYQALHGANITASGYPPAYFAEQKIKEITRQLARLQWSHKEIRILNFGCGVGNSEGFIRAYLPKSLIYSVDVSAKSVDYARDRHRDLPNVTFGLTDGRSIPFSQSFDVIFIANVLHHTPRPDHVRTVRMLYERLAPQGWLYIFEHNPLNPLTVRAFNTCPFDKGARLLPPWYARKMVAHAGFNKRILRFTLFFPKRLEALVPAEKYLSKVPFGAQYYIAAQKVGSNAESYTVKRAGE